MSPLEPSTSGFDWIVLGWLLLGLFRGFQRGISEELLRVTPWLCSLWLAGSFHEAWGGKIVERVAVPVVWGMVLAYLGILVAVLLLFFLLRKLAGEKLISSHVLGRGERLFGMASGLVRYACMALVFMAFVNAPEYSPNELAAARRKPPPLHPGEVRYPTFAQIQEFIMVDSWTGRFARDNLTTFLITPLPHTPINAPKERETRAKKLEKEIEKTLQNK